MAKRIVVVSDYNFKGSGYLNIAIPICKGLAALGYEVKAVGLGYTGEEHTFDFSIIPCNGMGDARAMVNNLHYQWKTDLVIVALDIPQLDTFIQLKNQLGFKLIAITPLENPPLTFTWANTLTQVDKVLFISQLGKDEAIKAGLTNVDHLVVGMDTHAWRKRTSEEYTKGREMLNIKPDTQVIITVADNQERKNLSKAMEIVSKLKHEKGKKVKYLLVTREKSSVGWKLRDLAMTYGIAPDVMIFERGISFKELYTLYAVSDFFLLTSKAEGLCMPVMEAMSVGVPVVSTACGAIPELLADGRGFLMETEYSMIDPWGNERRDFPSANSGVEIIDTVSKVNPTAPEKARAYIETRDWNTPVEMLSQVIEELTNEK